MYGVQKSLNVLLSNIMVYSLRCAASANRVVSVLSAPSRNLDDQPDSAFLRVSVFPFYSTKHRKSPSVPLQNNDVDG
jgi:hypothetical protein